MHRRRNQRKGAPAGAHAEVVHRKEFEQLQGQLAELRRQLKKQERQREKERRGMVASFKRTLNDIKKRTDQQLQRWKNQVQIRDKLKQIKKEIDEIENKLKYLSQDEQKLSNDIDKWYDQYKKKCDEKAAQVIKSAVAEAAAGTKAKVDADEEMKHETKLAETEPEQDPSPKNSEEEGDARLMVCMGKTGVGKSTFLNRFCGDTTEFGDDEKLFEVDDDVEACTQAISCSRTLSEYDNKIYYCVDTPGALDPDGAEAMQRHDKNLCMFLRGCGGVNVFLIVFSLTDVRVDQSFVEILKHYSQILNDDTWWYNVILIGTNRDRFVHNNKKLNKALNNVEDQDERERITHDVVVQRTELIRRRLLDNRELKIPKIPKDLKTPDAVEKECLPCIACGHNNYEDAVRQLTEMINHTIESKFICENIRYDMGLYQKQEESLVEIKKEIEKLEKKKSDLEKTVENLTKQLK